jgi:hypothetical protein
MNPTTKQTTRQREQGACAALAQAEGARAWSQHADHVTANAEPYMATKKHNKE